MKTVWAKPTGVRIPQPPPKKRNTNTCCLCFSFLFIEGFERLGSRRVNETIITLLQRADQTADETAVCETGVIANVVCGANPSASANQNLNRIRKCLIWVFLLQKCRVYQYFRLSARRRFTLFRVRMGVFVSLIPYHSFVQTEKSIDKTLFIWYYIFIRKEGLVSSK